MSVTKMGSLSLLLKKFATVRAEIAPLRKIAQGLQGYQFMSRELLGGEGFVLLAQEQRAIIAQTSHAAPWPQIALWTL